MQKNSFIVLLLVLLFSQEKIAAQNNLSLKEAVTTALQNSYDIKLVENTVSIAKNNNNYGAKVQTRLIKIIWGSLTGK